MDGGGKLHRIEGAFLKLLEAGLPYVTDGFGERFRGSRVVVGEEALRAKVLRIARSMALPQRSSG
jgi:hypothetical protein